MQRVRQLGYAQFQPPCAHYHFQCGTEPGNIHTDRCGHNRGDNRSRSGCNCSSDPVKEEKTGCTNASTCIHASTSSTTGPNSSSPVSGLVGPSRQAQQGISVRVYQISFDPLSCHI